MMLALISKELHCLRYVELKTIARMTMVYGYHLRDKIFKVVIDGLKMSE